MLKFFSSSRVSFCDSAVKASASPAVFGLLVLMGAAPLAQPMASPAVKPSAVQSSAGDSPSRYVVGPDDTLTINVLKHPEFSMAQAIVPQNGLLTVPVVGTLRVTGKTLEQLDAELTRGLSNRLRRPEVTITLDKPRPRPIYIVGPVRNPGILDVKNNWRITEALTAAGGLSVDATLAAVTITRSNRRLIDVPLLPLIKDPTDSRNIGVRSGDTVRFYERKVAVTVTGAVANPGPQFLPYGNGVAQAVSFAGGPTPLAALSRATIRRANGTIVPVNLYKAIVLNDTNSNMALSEGDVIVIPEAKDRISVLGAVVKPGYYPMDDGRNMTVGDAVALAGGAKPNAALTRATLRRANGVETPVDLYRVLVQGVDAENIPLRADDTISIPESRGITVIGEVASPGSYPLEEGKRPRVSDALATAGGLKIKPELTRISVARTGANGRLIAFKVDPVGLLEFSDLSQNMALQDGDIVSVAALKRTTVFVNGEVKSPGAYDLSEGDGVVELISRAGGATPDAALSQVSVTHRDGSSTVINTTSAILEGTKRVGAPLQDGDNVVVLRSERRVLVTGAVAKPGTYAIPENRPLTIGDALSLAGGAQNNAKKITVMRPNGTSATSQTLRLDRAENGVLAVTQLVQSGDVIYVPEGKRSQTALQSILSFLPAARFLGF